MKDIVFINGDDFGFNEITNDRISYCLLNNLISSTTLLVNMSGFKDAIKRIHKYKFYGRVGIHLNLTEGYPLSDLMNNKLIGESFKHFELKHFYKKIESHIIYHELKAQLMRMLEYGIIPSHIDSHLHAHKYYSILRNIKKVSNEYHIKYIRNTRNLFIERNNFKKIIFKKFYQSYFLYNKINTSKYFTALYPYIKNHCKLVNVELMCHPGEDDEFEFLRSDTYKEFIDKNQHKIEFKDMFLQ